MAFLKKLFGDSNEREVRRLWKLVEQVNDLEPAVSALADADFPARTAAFRERLAQGETLDGLLPEAFALAREAARRTTGMRPFDVQVLGGIVLHRGRIAEMKTGEGKTLVATMPAYLNALSGKGVHIVTVNDYLARRDSEWMGPVYRFLGLEVGLVVQGSDQEQRRRSYRADIVYVTNNELGFDYLRDNMVLYQDELVQRDLQYAIVDEVDSILVDEARTPLIISSRVESSEEGYSRWKNEVEHLIRRQNRMVNEMLAAAQENLDRGDRDEAGEQLLLARRGAPKNKKLLKILKGPGMEKLVERTKHFLMTEKRLNHLDEELYFAIDETTRIADIKDKGYRELERVNPAVSNLLRLDKDRAEEVAEEKESLEAAEHRHYFDQLIKAYALYERDVDYVVQDGKVIIVDEFTGRLMWGRRYSDGLHQAIEAKEGVQVQSDTRTVASITFQNYFRMYRKLAGMTGTAATEEDEFIKIYSMDVVSIPTNKPLVRNEMRDRVYKTERAKFKAALEEIERRHELGQPVLVGTVSVEKSEMLSKMLKRQGIPHEVLNAVNHTREAQIIAQAGSRGAVTISTNMAGRGTDIVLGGNPEFLIRERLEKQFGKGESELDEAEKHRWQEQFTGLMEKALPEVELERDKILSLGGLHVLGTERHESRRIDNQLRGRSGRQGDPGSSQFFVSLEDDLMRLFGSDNIAALMDRFGMEEDIPIDHSLVSGAIERAQKKVESRNFEIRRHLLDYDDVLNKQREVIYTQRRRVLEGADMRQAILEMVERLVDRALHEHIAEKGYLEEAELHSLLHFGESSFLRPGRLEPQNLEDMEQPEIRELLLAEAGSYYEARERELGHEVMRELERVVLLRTVDRHWMQFIDEMQHLRQEVYSQVYAQRDPLVEYRIQGHNMFENMIALVEQEVVRAVYRLKVMARPQRQAVVGDTTSVRPRVASLGTGAAADGAPSPAARQPQLQQPVTVEKKVGRNAPCTCGSGKKYKKCCGQ